MTNQTEPLDEEITTSPEVTQRSKPETRRRPLNIPSTWTEIACIDFTGYVDRDCNERVIYKTPGGKLKAVRSDVGFDQPNVEDVSRKDVASWIRQCVIPAEFEADFVVSPQSESNGAAPIRRPFIRAGGLDMRLCHTCGQASVAELAIDDARMRADDALEDAITRTNALTEALAILVLACEDAHHPLMSNEAVNGLQSIAMTEGAELRESYDRIRIAHRMELEGGRRV